MSYYVASRFRNKDLVRQVTGRLFTHGFTATQRWTEEPAGLLPEIAAARDLVDIDRADELLILTEQCELVPGGMHVEFGYALAKEKRISVIGPRVNVFYHLPNIRHYETVSDFFDALSAYQGEGQQ